MRTEEKASERDALYLAVTSGRQFNWNDNGKQSLVNGMTEGLYASFYGNKGYISNFIKELFVAANNSVDLDDIATNTWNTTTLCEMVPLEVVDVLMLL